MTNTEKNRLIEAFMGWELKFMTGYGLNDGWCFVNKHTGKTISGMYNDSELPYCTDWNWLMEALYSFDMLKLSIPEKHQGEFNGFNGDIKSYVISYNIDDAVNALCEGIEWYNSTLNFKNMNYLDIDTLNDYPSFQSDKSFTGGRGPIDD